LNLIKAFLISALYSAGSLCSHSTSTVLWVM
jgi:hypothetical protein